MKKNLLPPLLLVVTLFLIEIPSSFAQAPLPPGFNESISITVTPPTPSPGETVQIKLQSFSRDLNTSTISWSQNGILQKSGLGEFFYNFTAPNAGQKSIIDISVFKEGSNEIKEQVILSPGSIDLVYEADTYTPPLYKGRSMFSPQSTVTIAAFPEIIENGRLLDKSRILYTWERDGEVLQELSGIGRDSVRFTGSVISRPFRIAVTAKSSTSGVTARDSILISTIKPKVIVYENSALQGNILEKALFGSNLFDKEGFGTIAVPYFFSISSKDDSSIAYSWEENGKRLSVPVMESDMLFTNEGLKKSGLSDIFVSVSHNDHILQSANYEFTFNIVGSSNLNSTTISDETTIF